MAIEKKSGNINVHLPPSVELKVRQLGEHVGMSASEYITGLIEDHLAEKELELSVLQRIFRGNGSGSSEGT